MQKLRAKYYRHKIILEAPYIFQCAIQLSIILNMTVYQFCCLQSVFQSRITRSFTYLSVINNFCHPSLRCQTPCFHDQLLQVFLNSVPTELVYMSVQNENPNKCCTMCNRNCKVGTTYVIT